LPTNDRKETKIHVWALWTVKMINSARSSEVDSHPIKRYPKPGV
jgi:hypothetical protein